MNNIIRNPLLWLVLLAVALAACGGQTPPATQPAATEEPAPLATQPSAIDEPATQPTEATSSEPATGEISFSADVLPIFEARCIRCHGTSRQNGGLMLNSYAAVLAGGTDGAVVIPGDAAGSTMVRLITEGEMPKNSSPLSAEQITLISEWINAGALDN